MRTPAQLRLIRQASAGPGDSADLWRRKLEDWMEERQPMRILWQGGRYWTMLRGIPRCLQVIKQVGHMVQLAVPGRPNIWMPDHALYATRISLAGRRPIPWRI